MSLRAVELPGVRAQLPQWATRETSSNSAFGAHVVEEPGTNGFIALRWMASSEATPDQILDQHRAFLPASIEFDSREDAAVGGHPGATASAHTSNGKLHLALTGWSCPTDHRTLTLVTLLERSPSELRALHQRLLSGIACHSGTAQAPAAAVRFDPGPGLTRREHPVNLVYSGEGELVDFSPGIPGRRLLGLLAQNQDLRQKLVAAELELPGTELREVGASGSDERRLWTGETLDKSGGKIRVTMLALYCPASDLAVLGFHTVSSTAPESRGQETLARATCP
ncbi:MAG TPA: hypothetical protein VGK67_08990 [Myxococcales bacterium]